MAMPATSSIELLSWVKAEIDHALKLVRASIAKFQAPPHDLSALDKCPLELHQVEGALRMVGLEGAARVCAAIERALAAVVSEKNAPLATIAIIDQTISELGVFIDDLSKGEANVPIKLFPL
jgi:chemosensory pili system protein ChpA (sensor histidine kinase/response regulator)